MLIVDNTNLKGRGVFAQKHFLKGELIERVPVVVIPAEQVEFLDKTTLGNYYYDWEDKAAAIALGLSSLINHSYHPNAYYVKKFADRELDLIAYRDIEAGEEITANYNGSPDDKSPIWFDVVDELSSTSLDISENDVGTIHELSLPRISSNAELIFGDVY